MPTALVLSGGGVYGAALLGALHTLWYELFPQTLSVVAGTSIGAIIGTLLVMGHAPMDLLHVAMRQQEPMMTPDFSGFSVASQDKLRSFVEQLILEKCPFVPTFTQVYERYKVDLVVTGTNLTDRKAVYFHRHDHPDMSVLDALMISSCVPFIFPYIVYKGAVYVDGFVTDNLPFRFVERFCPPETRVYGIWTHPVHGTDQGLTTLQEYAMAVFNTFLGSKTYSASPGSTNTEITRIDIRGNYNPLIAHARDLESLFYEGAKSYVNSLKENPRKMKNIIEQSKLVQNDDPLPDQSRAVQHGARTTDLVANDRTILEPERPREPETIGL